jgi:hypothetical protein
MSMVNHQRDEKLPAAGVMVSQYSMIMEQLLMRKRRSDSGGPLFSEEEGHRVVSCSFVDVGS